MLPNFSLLHLDERSATTGKFCVISNEKAAELNAGGRGDPITFEDFAPNRERLDAGATFCVRNRNRTNGGTYDYTYYNARSLWNWARDNAKLPLTGDDIWREDWWLLRDRYDPHMLAPSWVKSLPMLEPNKPDGRDLLYEDEDEDEDEDWDSEDLFQQDLSGDLEEEEEAWSHVEQQVSDELYSIIQVAVEAEGASRSGPGHEASLLAHLDQMETIVNDIATSSSHSPEYETGLIRVLKGGDSHSRNVDMHYLLKQWIDAQGVGNSEFTTMNVRGILLSLMAKLLEFRVEDEGALTVSESVDELVAILRSWDVRSKIRECVDHFLTNAHIENSALRDWQTAQKDQRILEGALLLHFTKWGDFVPRDGDMSYQLSRMAEMRTPRQLGTASPHQEKVLTALSVKTSELVIELSKLDHDVISSQLDSQHGWFQDKIDEVGRDMLATWDFPYTQSRIAIAVLVWIIMLNVLETRRIVSRNWEIVDERVTTISRHLMRLAKTCAGVVDPYIAPGSPVNGDALDNFFWKFVAIEYEEEPYDSIPHYTTEWGIHFAKRYWRSLELAEAHVRTRPSGGEATPNRRRQRRS